MSRAKHPHPWLFALTGIPYGVAGTFSSVVMGHLAEKAGIDLGKIGWYVTLLLVPSMLQFLYAPLVDIGLKRKQWLVLFAAVSAACFAGAYVVTPRQTTAFLVLAFIGQVASGLVGACNGGLLAASMPDDLRGKASGALNIGNLSGGGISAGLILWMSDNAMMPAMVAGLIIAMGVLPALTVLFVDEPDRPAGRTIGDVFGSMWKDVSHVLFSRSGVTGIALCLSPVGTAALANYFSGMTKPYAVSDGIQEFVNGPANVVLTAIGAFVGGWLCDRYNRRAMYLLSGALTALSGIAMALSPRNEINYAVFVMLYALITGFCYSSFTATVLETIGEGGKAAATKYTVFVAAGNVAIAYVGFIDTRFSDRHGVAGVIGADAGLNLLGVVVLGVVFWRLRSFGKSRRPTTHLPTAQIVEGRHPPTAPEP